MKLLIFTQCYHPDHFKINEISFELNRMGNEVTVLTGLPDYATGRVPKEYRWFRRRDERLNGVRVLRVPIVARHTGAIWRALNYASFALTALIRARRLDGLADAMLCYQVSPVSSAHAAVAMRKRTGRKLLLYCLDLWPESLKAWDVPERSWVYRLALRYSRRIYRNCDVIAISSPPFRSYLTDVIGVEDRRIVYLPQYAERMECPAPAPHAPGEDSCVHLAFAGNIGRVQDVECIVRAAGRIRDAGGFMIHIYGNGSNYEACRALARQLGVEDRVRFYGRIPHDRMAEEYRRMDAFLLTLRDEGFIGMTIPAKLQEYMSAGRPIIAAIGGAAADVIRDAGCGLLAPPSDDEALAQRIAEFARDPGQYRGLGENALKYFGENFSREVFFARLNTILQEL